MDNKGEWYLFWCFAVVFALGIAVGGGIVRTMLGGW